MYMCVRACAIVCLSALYVCLRLPWQLPNIFLALNCKTYASPPEKQRQFECVCTCVCACAFVLLWTDIAPNMSFILFGVGQGKRYP